MKYYYGNDYKEALGNVPVEIKTTKQLRQYEENYNVVIPADEVDEEECDDEDDVDLDEAVENEDSTKLKNYILLIGNGTGASSRGTEPEILYTFRTDAKDVDDALNQCVEEIREIDVADDYEDEDLTYADYFNDRDVGSGCAWLIAYLENGKLENCYDFEQLAEDGVGYEFDNYADADLFGITPYAPFNVDDDEDDYDEVDEEDYNDEEE